MNRIDTLEPEFRTKVEKLLAALPGVTGRKWGAPSARRTLAEQATIYAQGRTAPGKVVSNAPPGSSAHNFGLAVDLVPLTPDGIDFWWEAPDDLFRQMANLARAMGLVPGYYFKSIHDADHVEDPTWRQAQARWQEGKLTVA